MTEIQIAFSKFVDDNESSILIMFEHKKLFDNAYRKNRSSPTPHNTIMV